MNARDWFDQIDPCPRCGHWCMDHAACTTEFHGDVIDPPCGCTHPAHFEGDLTPDGVLATRSGGDPQ